MYGFHKNSMIALKIHWRQGYDHSICLTLRGSSTTRDLVGVVVASVAILMHRRGWSPPVTHLECMCRCDDVRRIRAPRGWKDVCPRGGFGSDGLFVPGSAHTGLYHIFTIHVYDCRLQFIYSPSIHKTPVYRVRFLVTTLVYDFCSLRRIIRSTDVSGVFFVPLLRIVVECQITIRHLYVFDLQTRL